MLSKENGLAPRGETPPSSEASGLAALLLVESLIHELCSNATLTGDQAVDIVETAIDVQRDLAEAAELDTVGDGSVPSMWRSHALLCAIAASLRINLRGRLTPVRLV